MPVDANVLELCAIALAVFATAAVYGLFIYAGFRFITRGRRPAAGEAEPDSRDCDDYIPEAQQLTEVIPAGAFVCDKCGRRNYFDLISTRASYLPGHDISRLPDAHGNAYAGGSYYMQPHFVRCGYCHVVFAVADPYLGPAPEGETK